MTQEEKQLLLQDLCARLPYGVKCSDVLDDGTYGGLFRLSDKLNCKHLRFNDIPYAVRPYLRPMSSMTKEEMKELQGLVGSVIYDEENNTIVGFECNTFEQFTLLENWLNKNMFDYRGLIPMGLAIEAPEDMYK